MDHIRETWKEVNDEYNDMMQRLTHIEKKNMQILEKKHLKDKIIMLSSDLNEVKNTMERICCSIDDIYSEEGTIGTHKINDELIFVYRDYCNNYNNCNNCNNCSNSKYKLITHVSSDC